VKMFANLSRFIYSSEPPQPPAAPFDDGLAEIARLIAREDPVKADALPTATAARLDRSFRPKLEPLSPSLPREANLKETAPAGGRLRPVEAVRACAEVAGVGTSQ
jgi:hypothetical protein